MRSYEARFRFNDSFSECWLVHSFKLEVDLYTRYYHYLVQRLLHSVKATAIHVAFLIVILLSNLSVAKTSMTVIHVCDYG